MKAIIVSAGQGQRLLPLTEDRPKCLLPIVGDLSMLEVQLHTLVKCGVTDVSVMVGNTLYLRDEKQIMALDLGAASSE